MHWNWVAHRECHFNVPELPIASLCLWFPVFEMDQQSQRLDTLRTVLSWNQLSNQEPVFS